MSKEIEEKAIDFLKSIGCHRKYWKDTYETHAAFHIQQSKELREENDRLKSNIEDYKMADTVSSEMYRALSDGYEKLQQQLEQYKAVFNEMEKNPIKYASALTLMSKSNIFSKLSQP